MQQALVDPFASLDDDYESAVLHLAWAIDRSTNARILLCAGLEFVPVEIPPPEVGGERFEKLSKRYFLYARDLVLSARRALRWFEDTERGDCLRPEESGRFADANN